MAKNVLQKKKRVSHFQRTMDMEGGSEYALSGCDDFLSSIMKSMDSRYEPNRSGNTKKCIEIFPINKVPREDSASSSKSISQNPNASKCKRFSLSRKYPLMEKSQKFLKQIKHNQKSIPKPRAHLATIAKSPVRKNTFCNATKASTVNREKPKETQKLRKINLFNVSSNNSSHINNDSISKISKNLSKTEHKTVENIKSNKSNGQCENDSIKSSIKTNTDIGTGTLCDVDDFEANGDTTDSEYERFVKENKKGLRKKKSKRLKQNATVSQASKNLKRKKPADVLEQTDSHSCDGSNILKSSNLRKTRSCKKQKIACEGLTDAERNVLEDSESIPNVCTRDSSSRSDNDGNVTMSKASTKNLKRKKTDSRNCDGSNILESSNTRITRSCKNQKITCEGPTDTETRNVMEDYETDMMLDDVCTRDSSSESDNETTLTNRFQPLVENACSSQKETEPFNEINSLSDEISRDIVSCQKINAPETSICDDIVSNSALHNSFPSCVNNPVSVKIEQSHLPSNSIVIDLSDSDDDDSSNVMSNLHPKMQLEKEKIVNGNCTMAKNSIHPDSDDSDIEVIEIVPNQPIETKCVVSVPADRHNLNTTAVNEDKRVKIENDSVDEEILPVVVKVESCSAKDSLIKSLSASDVDDDSNVVYMTNICNEFSHTEVSEQSVSNQSSQALDASSKDSSFGNADSKKVIKREKESDDEIVILETVETSVLRSTKVVRTIANRSTAQIENIKIEPPNSENKLNVCNSVHTKSESSETCNLNQGIQDFIPLSSTDLLDLYKREFEIYMEMKEAEANVEASLKNLQTHQAEKVHFIRSLVKKYIGSGPITKLPSCKDPTSLLNDKQSMFSPLEMPEENSVQKVQKNVIDKLSLDNASSLSPQIASTSTVGEDIKPDINKLHEQQNDLQVQHTVITPKLEALQEAIYSSKSQSVQKQTLKLSAEKCNVCGKEAIAACQGCAKVFFCSHECGKKFWKDGHGKLCGVK